MNAGIEAPAYLFHLSGGHLSLDFTNTLSDRVRDEPQEHLQCYEDLVAWSSQTSILTATEGQELLRWAGRSVAEAGRVHQRALALREALYRIFGALALDEDPPEADLALLNTLLVVALAHLQVVPQQTRFVWEWMAEEGELDRMLWPVVRAAADLLTSEQLESVKLCMAEDCGWLFLDASRNGSRRWCSMRECGNRAKVNRFNARQRTAKTA